MATQQHQILAMDYSQLLSVEIHDVYSTLYTKSTEKELLQVMIHIHKVLAEAARNNV